MGRQRIAVVTNENSGKGTPRAGLSRVVGNILSARHRVYSPQTLEELDGIMDDIHAERPDIIGIASGDGGVRHVIDGTIQRYHGTGEKMPDVLLLSTGSMNVVATCIGADRMSAPDLAVRVLRKVEHGIPLDTVRLNTLRVNDRHCFVYGAGLPVNILERYNDPRAERGNIGAAKLILRSAATEIGRALRFNGGGSGLMAPVHAKVTFPDADGDDRIAPYMRHTALMSATIDQLSFGCTVFPDAMTRPGRFMLRSTQLSFWEAFRNIPQLWAGLPLSKTHDAVPTRAVIEYDEPTTVTLDGDLFTGHRRDELSCGPSLRFITG